ncbi:MAG TPA: ABC transporter ATP-binding protein [Clostridia bacterium]|nr:ABC transporter ATP-binding protein [Clostridia bacterium]
MMLLELRQLRKDYKRGEKTFPAVDNIDLSVRQADFICIKGRSGSGKSTLLGMIAGLLSPTSGSIGFEGRDFSELSDQVLSYIRNTSIGYIPQGRSILSNLTVFDNVRLPFFLQGRKGNPSERALSLLHDMGLGGLADAYPAQLSGGELRRVSIARALINSPSLILADEPTGDLDQLTARGIVQLFKEISTAGTAVIMVTHEPDLSGYGNNRLFTMDSGSLTEESYSFG